MTVAQWIRGLPVGVCQAIKGAFDYPSSVALTATGASLATGLALPRDFNVFTTVAASTGCVLPAAVDQVVQTYTDANGTTRTITGVVEIGDTISVVNRGANSLSVYPFVSTGTIQGGGAGAAFAVGTNKVADFRYVGGGNWVASLSA